jgi:hypothetical protein
VIVGEELVIVDQMIRGDWIETPGGGQHLVKNTGPGSMDSKDKNRLEIDVLEFFEILSVFPHICAITHKMIYWISFNKPNTFSGRI